MIIFMTCIFGKEIRGCELTVAFLAVVVVVMTVVEEVTARNWLEGDEMPGAAFVERFV